MFARAWIFPTTAPRGSTARQCRSSGGAPPSESIPSRSVTDPAEVPVSMERRSTRVVPVTPSFQGFLEPGYELLSFDINPPEIEVSGPASAVARVSDVQTDSIELAGRNADFTVKARVINKESLVSISGQIRSSSAPSCSARSRSKASRASPSRARAWPGGSRWRRLCRREAFASGRPRRTSPDFPPPGHPLRRSVGLSQGGHVSGEGSIAGSRRLHHRAIRAAVDPGVDRGRGRHPRRGRRGPAGSETPMILGNRRGRGPRRAHPALGFRTRPRRAFLPSGRSRGRPESRRGSALFPSRPVSRPRRPSGRPWERVGGRAAGRHPGSQRLKRKAGYSASRQRASRGSARWAALECTSR